MASSAPIIDSRTATDIGRQVNDLLAVYVPAWPRDPSTGDPIESADNAAGLVGIFARYVEIIIQRLNQVPQKNLLAYLDLLGNSLLPPQPARVPLTFSLAAGSVTDVVVRSGTQAAAPPTGSDKEPLLFETERDLVVTAAQLADVFARDPRQDKYADDSMIVTSAVVPGIPAFEGILPIDHVLYVGQDDLLRSPAMQEVRLTFGMQGQIDGEIDPRSLQWEIWDGLQGIPITSADATVNLTRDGDVVFTNLAPISPQMVSGSTSRWLRCRLTTRITTAKDAQAGMVRTAQLLNVETIRVTVRSGTDDVGLPVEAASANQVPIDPSTSFYPFGEKPRLGDCFYLANRQAFSTAGARVTLNVVPAVPGGMTGQPKLHWEFWNGTTWRELQPDSKIGQLQDDTAAFTVSDAKRVSFTIYEQPALTTVNGVESYWVRVRIVSGNYGLEARYEPSEAGQGYKLIPATFAPPSINSISVGYSLTKTATPDAVLAYNDFSYQDVTPIVNQPGRSFAPFQPAQDSKPTFYLGFTLPPSRNAFANQTLSLYFRVADVLYGQPADNPTPSAAPRLAWEYWRRQSWASLTVQDETEAFTRSGLVELLPPADLSSHTEFGLEPRYWLRVRWESGDYAFNPRLCRAQPNTTMATQSVTIRNEVVGSSSASKGLHFHTTRTPILHSQQLEVREAEMPSAAEQERIAKEEGPTAIGVTRDAAGRPQEIWVRWHEVPDFYASGPRDRHYILDHLGGEIRFGDGLNGLIPPLGAGNIRMARYQAGGGRAGNRPAGTIIQLNTTVPYIDAVSNPEPATGGADAETMDLLLGRAPRTVRHSGRAVTREDFEDLAMLASPEVARVKCVPLRDLSVDPLGATITPGAVSVIIVPRSTDLKPLPNLNLISTVQGYLNANATPTASAVVVGPLYVRVAVMAEIVLTSLEGAGAVERAVLDSLTAFLHPLTGGPDGTGWAFGREPHKSDLYALIEQVPGVDHIRALAFQEFEDLPGAKGTGRFLVYSGAHTVSSLFGVV